MIVKVVLPTGEDTIDAACIYTLPEGVAPKPVLLMRANAALIAKRFRPGERQAFFHADVEKGIFQIGDRAPAQDW